MTGQLNPQADTRWYADPVTQAPSVDTPAPALDEDLDVLDDAGARRLNKRALGVLGLSVVVLLALMLWVGKSFGSSRQAASPLASTPLEVESPDMPGSVDASGVPGAEAPAYGGSGGQGSAVLLQGEGDANLPPLPPEPVQLAQDLPVENSPSPSNEDVPPMAASYAAPAPARASLVQRRIWNGDGPQSLAGGSESAMVQSAQPDAVADASAGMGKVRRLQHPSTLLVRGTSLRCALASRIVSDLQGFTACVLVEPVYAVDGHTTLLARGTRLMGRYGSGAGVGDRLEVQWDRALTPDGLDVALGGLGTDTLGGAGHPGKGNGHWGTRIASAMMISVLSDGFKYAAAKNGPRETAVYAGGTVVSEPFNSNTAQTAQALAEQALSQNAGRPRTVVIKQGTLLNVYVTEDIDFHAVLAPSSLN